MKLSPNALGSLINRYRAVLKKCRLLSLLGTLVLAGSCVWSGLPIFHATAFAAPNVDGNDNDGKIVIDGGEYGDIIGKGKLYTASNSATADEIYSGASVSVQNITANRIFGAALYLSPAYGHELTATVRDNVIKASNINVGEFYGGMACITDSKGNSAAVAENNSFQIEKSAIETIYGQMAVLYPGAGNNAAIAKGGHFAIRDTTVTDFFYGGVAASNIIDGNLTVDGGILTVDNSRVATLVSSYAQSFVTSGDISLKNSTITVTGNSTIENINGGYAYVESGNVDNIEIENNIIELNGGTVSKAIYAAAIDASDASIGNATIRNNTVIVRGRTNLENANVFGYALSGDNGAATITTSNNTLAIDSWRGKIKNINNFNVIRFTNINWNDKGTVVAIANEGNASSLADTSIDLRGSTVLAGGQTLKVNEYMYFIKAENGNLGTGEDNILIGSNANGDNVFTAGVTFEGTGEVSVEEDGSVKYTITGLKTSDQTKIVTENSAASLSLLTKAGDLIVDGLNHIEKDQQFGLKTFAIFEGFTDHYNFSDGLDINGWNGLFGIGGLQELYHGRMAYATFFETGMGYYNKDYTVANEEFSGTGNLRYYGGGVAARYTHDTGFYADASLRAGSIENETHKIMRDGNGSFHDYHLNTAYYGFHAGLGKTFSLTDTSFLDFYGRYYHTFMSDNEFTVAGDRFTIDALTSERFRLGTRYSLSIRDDWHLYCGTAWDYEMHGESSASVNDVELPEDSLTGSSYLGELGFKYASDHSPWSVEGNLKGYLGHREGVSGMVTVSYSF